ncbi:hypothetical protein J1792_31700 [Streptomyces triculaminicus]|uniref:Uncharacterized protein n=1 Tax=Streptomyces triculaminicus TaxID=2816232 RepID=A0A939FS57_9ACTN|nr:hypothetical protein [Streptomyces triculaminicus]MBO0657125.1 hypothetical protein [Streptomyces triculaminicus]
MSEPLALAPYTMWRDALVEVDEIFASPPGLDRPVGGCTYCVAESELRVLGGDPADVPDDLLRHFMREVAGHWDEDQYSTLWRRFIPRALRRWGPDGSGAGPSGEMGRLGCHGARLADWPVAERAAVERAFQALLRIAVTDGRPYWEITDLVEGIAHATGGLERWLHHIAGLTGPEADAGVVRVASGWADDLLLDELEFTWWHDGDPQLIATWLPALRARMAAFAVRNPRCKNASDALIAIDALEAGTPGPWLSPYDIRALSGPALIHQG